MRAGDAATQTGAVWSAAAFANEHGARASAGLDDGGASGRRLAEAAGTADGTLADDADVWRWPMATAPGIDALYGGHFNLTSSEFASAMNWRLTLLPENANCSAYLTQAATPETLAYLAGNVSDGTNAVGTNVRSCDDAGVAADECCYAWKGYHRASRVWYQDSDLSANAANEAFGTSELLGAGIHTHPHATVGDFNADMYPDVIVGNRLYVNDGRGSFVHAAGAVIGHGTRAFKMVFAGDIDGRAPDDLVVVYDDGSVEVFLTIFDPSNTMYLSDTAGIGFRSVGTPLAPGAAQVTTCVVES